MAYEDLDRYEGYGSEYEGSEEEQYGADEEEEEDVEPKKEVLEFIGIRQKLKEAARKKLASENGSLSNSHDRRMAQLPKFGSFFGPSQPSISDRVIQERKSLIETQHIASGVSSHQKDRAKKNDVPNTSAPKIGTSDRRPLDPIKNKVQKLKDTRDYSFLTSDDTDVPAAPPMNKATGGSNTVPRSTQVPLKSRECSQIHRKPPPLSKEHEARRAAPMKNSHARPTHHNQPTQKMSSSSLRPSDSRRPEKPLIEQQRSRKQLQPSSGNSHVASGAGRPRDLSAKMVAVPSSLERRPGGVTSMQRRDGPPVVRQSSSSSVSVKGGAITNNGQRVAPVKALNGVVNRNPTHPKVVERQVLRQESFKGGKPLPKSILPSSKSQAVMRTSSKQQQQMSSHRKLEEVRNPKPMPKPKPKPKRRLPDEDDGGDYRSEIRKLFGYDPSRYANIDDDDDSDMEADFRTIQREESRSSRIAREEDEEQLLLIQQEEEREKRRKLAKRRRLD